ncbi:MAG: hypothetical protein IAE82_13210 [Opitutaceae bacterium]|nr:hypothetical protein [Opitutaceae bacterium]
MHRSRPALSRRAFGCAVVAGVLATCLGGCVGTDFVEMAQDSLRRAFRFETPSSFFQPALERARGDREVSHMHVRARQHYLQIIASIERLTPEMREELRRDGLLGEAYSLKALAQWRLDRFDDARASIAVVRESNQEPLRARDRALFEGMAGTLKLEEALAANAASRPFAEVYAAAAGERGGWRLLATARTKVPAEDKLQVDLMQARLGCYACVVSAQKRDPRGAAALDPEVLPRLRAEAQVELSQLARTPEAAIVPFAATIRRWQVVCELDAPVR